MPRRCAASSSCARRLPMKSKLIPILVANLFAAAGALAAEGNEDMTVFGSVTVGVQGASLLAPGETNAAKLKEYRDIGGGGISGRALSGVDIKGRGSEDYFSLYGENLGRGDEYLEHFRLWDEEAEHRRHVRDLEAVSVVLSRRCQRSDRLRSQVDRRRERDQPRQRVQRETLSPGSEDPEPHARGRLRDQGGASVARLHAQQLLQQQRHLAMVERVLRQSAGHLDPRRRQQVHEDQPQR